MGASELNNYSQQFQWIADQARELTEGLSEARFNWRPGPSKWSIEECLGHLILVGNVEVAAIQLAIEAGKSRGLAAPGPFSYGPVERFVVGMSEPPVRTSMDALARFRPLHGQPITAVLPTFLHLQSQLILQTEAAKGLDLRRVKVATPISRFLRLSLGATFAQIVAHEKRHIEQARRVRDHLT